MHSNARNGVVEPGAIGPDRQNTESSVSELSRILALLRDIPVNKNEITQATYRLDENYASSSMEAMRLWRLGLSGGLAPLELERYSVALLSNTTQDFFLPHLYTAGFASGLDLQITWPGFDRIVELALDPHSALYEAQPQMVFLNYHHEARLEQIYYSTFTRNQRLGPAKDFLDEIALVVQNLRKNLPRAKIVAHSFYWFRPPVLGYIDATQPDGGSDLTEYLNDGLARLARETEDVYVLDMKRIVGQFGFTNWRNNNRWFSESVDTVSGNALLAREYLKVVKSFTKRNRKVIVLDLDNTLWGGLAGEEGVRGVQLGHAYPGNAYRRFQQILKLYSQRGVLLAINSKNNFDDAMTIIRTHPEMVLREEDFVAVCINWEDKSANMRRIAEQLDLGLNSFIFVDDSPQERHLIRHTLPEVLVPEFPRQIADLPYLLEQVTDLDYSAFTETDKQRTGMYRTETLRAELRKEASSIEEYQAMLGTRVVVGPASDAELERVEQMFQRTNQFNMTTKRYTGAELRAFAKSADRALIRVSMADRFGDLGIIAAAVVTFDATATIDSLLMSCRVIGRGVETVLLAYLSQLASSRGYSELHGVFAPSKKNDASRGVYSRHGFEEISREGGVELSVLRHLSDAPIKVPTYITWTEIGQ
jgi:FkbH-like protein